MSETSGRCRREVDSLDWIPGGLRVRHVLADALDRIAAGVADIKARADSVALETWVSLVEQKRDAAIRERDEAWKERDEARAEAERAKAELASRPAAAGWLTDEEKAAIKELLPYTFSEQQFGVLTNLLARAGSPPVVEVPMLVFGSGSYEMQKRYRAAMDKAGVQWREVPRE